jgi:YARHG domain
MKRKKIVPATPLLKYIFSVLLLFQFFALHAQEVDQDKVKEIIESNRLIEDQNMAGLIINGDISLLNRRIDAISIARLDRKQLRVLRNTIFAQYGYSFNSEDLQRHFLQFDWYSARSNNVDSQLSSVDLTNIDIIRQFEYSDKNSDAINSIDDLVGVWHVSPHVASGFHEVYQFYQDGRFTFNYSQMRELSTFFSFSGRYETGGAELLLYAESRKILAHKDDIELTGGWGYIWKDSRLETEPFMRQFRFPIDPIKTVGDLYEEAGVDKSRLIIEIGGILYFKYSDNPDDYM